jgi:hypothetical protein
MSFVSPDINRQSAARDRDARQKLPGLGILGREARWLRHHKYLIYIGYFRGT